VIYEHVAFQVDPAKIQEFYATVSDGIPIITSAKGCHRARVYQQHEDESYFILVVEWDSYEDHMAFRETPLFDEWKQVVWPYYLTPAVVTHYAQRI
jgi:quinol monooxygenase YgiN